MPNPEFIERYNEQWLPNIPDIEIERDAIRSGGRWKGHQNQDCGNGLFFHFKQFQTLLWPEDDHHRWSDQILSLLLEQRLVAVTGCRDSSKSDTVSKWALCDYWAFPHETLFLMTSTDSRGLELRVWGHVKKLFMRAKERFPWLEGNVVDARYGLFTDNIKSDVDARDVRKGIICVPTVSSQGEFLGMALRNFAGIKQKRRRIVGDELQFVPADYLKILDSLDKGDFKAALIGNPIGGNGKALDKVSEPEGGWGVLGEITKTRTWNNVYSGITINLVGTDSPNFDTETRNKFPYLLDQGDLDRVARRPGGKDSLEWWSQIMGVRKSGVMANRVMTVSEAQGWGAFQDCIWNKEPSLKIYAIDAGYGGDDCVGLNIEIGTEVSGKEVIRFGMPEVIPVLVSSSVTPEDQIATFAKGRCASLGIADENVFIEAGMRATLAIAFGRIMSPRINAINFGGQATERPVSNDLFVMDENGERRLKTCKEHYSKFVTELAFSVRYLCESNQARTFPREGAEEFERRQWEYVYGDRYELETKLDYKVRNSGKSPNVSDACAIAVEGARRNGFIIEALSEAGTSGANTDGWLEIEMRKYREKRSKRELKYS